jgi:acetyltransferase-like isoleucine patch superfamily enzyme
VRDPELFDSAGSGPGGDPERRRRKPTEAAEAAGAAEGTRPVPHWSWVAVRRRLAGRVRQAATSAIHAGWERACLYGAIGPTHPRAARFGAFGEGSLVAFPPGTVYNERWIRLGAGTTIGPWVSLAAGMAPGQQMLCDPVISVGDRVLIGRGSHIVGHLRITIGDDVQTGPYVYITDQNHGYRDPDLPIGIQWPTEAPVEVGAGSWLGAGVTVLPGARIGRNVAVGAGSVVVGVLPDHCVAVGAPARVVRRYAPEVGWQAIDRRDRERGGLADDDVTGVGRTDAERAQGAGSARR